MTHPLTRLLAAALVGAGVAVAGLAVSNGLERFRLADRTVTVKGLAEKDVESDFAIWTLAFRRGGSALARCRRRWPATATRCWPS